jgi:hypothetical protein
MSHPLPPKTDPRWEKLLTGAADPAFSSLATRLTVGRLRQTVKQQPSSLAKAVDEIHSFFINNSFAQNELPKL